MALPILTSRSEIAIHPHAPDGLFAPRWNGLSEGVAKVGSGRAAQDQALQADWVTSFKSPGASAIGMPAGADIAAVAEIRRIEAQTCDGGESVSAARTVRIG